MAALNRTRLVLWALVAVLAIVATGLYLQTILGRPTQAAGLGAGDYRLETTDGGTFERASLNGHPSALFFGFTHCPDVCPTTLSEMVAWYAALGADARDLKAYFVTVDPERDSAAILADYVGWTEKVIGVTGSRAEIDKAIKAWAVHVEKVLLEGGDYTMDHTASVFLLDRQGDFQGTIAYMESQETAIGKLRRLIGS
ncbi:protein SCO1/2 [Devosia enhydra]|uniref:Protein SCO1/2 n=1 Tax=Devosia enhydra TaxID=665118 RepID=A0A1K2I1Z4_9HYPH|nr:SCO family protein [Devosia enhydra]SFZ86271.1 protein SCO1/2 [Devosia enhydra]